MDEALPSGQDMAGQASASSFCRSLAALTRAWLICRWARSSLRRARCRARTWATIRSACARSSISSCICRATAACIYMANPSVLTSLSGIRPASSRPDRNQGCGGRGRPPGRGAAWSQAATSSFRGRPRGRLRGTTCPRRNSSPPQTPQGSLRSRAPLKQAIITGHSRQSAFAASTSAGASAKNSSGSSRHGRSSRPAIRVILACPVTDIPGRDDAGRTPLTAGRTCCAVA